MGNITSRSDVNGGASWTYHSTKKHAVATTGSGGTSYSYDANGNMTSRGGATITWASYNYPTGLATGSESTTFYYGPDRQYYRQVYTGPAAPTGYEETHYVGGILEKVYDGITFDWRHTIRAEGQVVAIVSRKSSGANAVHYALEDNQGSGSTLVDAAGTGYVRQSYNAFGLPRDGSDWDGAVPGGDQGAINAITRRGYTGHSMLGAMGLIHMNGRVQDAITGRFLSPDPNIPDPGFTQSYNRYAYVVNNPLSQIDPTGFLNAFLQEVCSSGFHPWAPDMQPNALAEMCFRSMSFWEASESGWLVGMTLRQAAHAGCPSFVMDCDGYHDWPIKTAPARREPIKEPPPDGHVSVGEPGPTYGSPQRSIPGQVEAGARVAQLTSMAVVGAGPPGAVVPGLAASKGFGRLAGAAGLAGDAYAGGRAVWQVGRGDYRAAAETAGQLFVRKSLTIGGGAVGSLVGPEGTAAGVLIGSMAGDALDDYVGPVLDHAYSSGVNSNIVRELADYMSPRRFLPGNW